ncbi:hypothetical protein EYF80_004479 [Liparis tanakae]|uniref:Uncharacterized protein n=1 Tax=Liparis tanakae TaxID=230148 RepID=A0A4Z2J4J3_9TELE|nr:hypothetical protein EYF80_004479 [Liparis tanakae]
MTQQANQKIVVCISSSFLPQPSQKSDEKIETSFKNSRASIRAASRGASATEWEQNRPDCVGREALARDQVHLKPPLILQWAAEPLYSPNATSNTCLA